MLVRVLLIVALLHSPAFAEDIYSVEGEVRGFFCRLFGMACSFKKVDAVAVGKEQPHALPAEFPTVSEFKPGKDATSPARCWVTTKADESQLGWYAYLFDWASDAPVFYAAKDDGSFEKLGSPQFVVFPCKKH